MNRRQAIGTLGSLLLPTWTFKPVKRSIDLQAFCDVDGRFDMSAPFVQEADGQLTGFATNARICLRVAASEVNLGDRDRNTPPANRLPWNFDTLRNWKPWPKQKRLIDKYSFAAQPLDGLVIDAVYDDLVRLHIGDMDYSSFDFPPLVNDDVRTCIAFRFDGGQGLLMTLQRDPNDFR